MLFAAFFAKEKLFPENGTVFKIVVTLRLVLQCATKLSKSEKMGAKFVRTTSTI